MRTSYLLLYKFITLFFLLSPLFMTNFHYIDKGAKEFLQEQPIGRPKPINKNFISSRKSVMDWKKINLKSSIWARPIKVDSVPGFFEKAYPEDSDDYNFDIKYSDLKWDMENVSRARFRFNYLINFSRINIYGEYESNSYHNDISVDFDMEERYYNLVHAIKGTPYSNITYKAEINYKNFLDLGKIRVNLKHSISMRKDPWRNTLFKQGRADFEASDLRIEYINVAASKMKHEFIDLSKVKKQTITLEIQSYLNSIENKKNLNRKIQDLVNKNLNRELNLDTEFLISTLPYDLIETAIKNNQKVLKFTIEVSSSDLNKIINKTQIIVELNINYDKHLKENANEKTENSNVTNEISGDTTIDNFTNKPLIKPNLVAETKPTSLAVTKPLIEPSVRPVANELKLPESVILPKPLVTNEPFDLSLISQKEIKLEQQDLNRDFITEQITKLIRDESKIEFLTINKDFKLERVFEKSRSNSPVNRGSILIKPISNLLKGESKIDILLNAKTSVVDSNSKKIKEIMIIVGSSTLGSIVLGAAILYIKKMIKANHNNKEVTRDRLN
ncbi:hypothetical protein [Spiroplasma alleghenense]|uniref:Uncharacterized protein n=1 Tax=Spiroplasma alleghenense TaxID=216931 RepID=A0A345Z423_9MOLU|nr:hypothetical protein [Spiroplasma alleghenense]AXK51352.1 hypothetical protein SALLE_v1c06820 [Spiroplasma alleghenense]